MSLKNYSATGLIGGGSGALDSIDGTNLTDKDSCMVFSAATFYFYTLDDDSGAAESSPDVISPDANAGNKRWILIAALGASGVIYLGNAGLYLADTNASHDLIFKIGSDLTADRILTITTGDAARTITFSGNPTLADWFDQAVKAASSPTFAGLTLTTDLAVIHGGTGSSTASGALVNLGLSATAAEINTACDGITATVAQLNAMKAALYDQKIWIYANVAPSGWNIVASTTDALLACKGGANAYNTTGGQQIGTWTQPNHTHTGPSHAHTTPAHTLSISEMPAHTHTVPRGTNSGSFIDQFVGAYTAGGTAGSGSTGGGSAHNHGNTGAAGTGATGGGATAITYRPLANLGIIIEKT